VSKAAVLFLLHDNMSVLERNFAAVDERMQQTFGDVVYCIYENDSTDGTAEWIRELAARRNDVRLWSEQGFRPARAEGSWTPWRLERMAACRNRCLDLARRHAPDADHAIVLDIDFASFEQVHIAAALREIEELHPRWQALCGSGMSQLDLGVFGSVMRVIPTRGDVPVRLFDIAALRTDPPRDSLAAAAMARPAFEPPVRVRSAFGGIAVYKPAALYALEYEGGDCEHISIHERMQEVFMSHKLSPLMVALGD